MIGQEKLISKGGEISFQPHKFFTAIVLKKNNCPIKGGARRLHDSQK